MFSREPRVDPIKDEAARAVIAAYKAAVAAKKPTPECYQAGVAAWRKFHPDHKPQYAGRQAVELILRTAVSLRVEA